MGKMQFSFNDTEDCKLWVVSDLHLNHKQEFLWKPRGFKSPEEHTRKVIEKINEVCRPQDILLSLGDYCLNTNFDQMLDSINRINCLQWWLKGNHNNPWEKNYQAASEDYLEYYEFETSNKCYVEGLFKPEVNGLLYLNKIVVFGSYLEFNWNGQMCTFFHYPISIWNQMQHGAWALCGHSHGSYQLSRPEDFTIKQLDCGWDLHNGPLDFNMIRKIMSKKNFKSKDHHNKDTT